MIDYYDLFHACVIFLVVTYACFVCAGILFFSKMVKRKVFKDELRNRLTNAARFFIYVVLTPVGLTCVLAIFIIQAFRFVTS